MLDNAPTRSTSHVLYREHLLLRPTFDPDGRPARYANEARPLTDAHTCLCDLTHAQVLLFSGEDVPSFAHAAFAGRPLGVGQCALEAALVGDGSVASVPLVARTGGRELVVVDPSPRAEVLDGWLSFLSGIEQEGYRPYGRMEVEDATRSHVVLGLWGPAAAAVLGDYVAAGALPGMGEVRACQLDRIPCIVMCVELGERPGYVVMVPPAHAVALWRSLLSFAEVEPVGMEGFAQAMARELPWSTHVSTPDALRVGAAELRRHGLVRTSGDYVGARGLLDRERGEQ